MRKQFQLIISLSILSFMLAGSFTISLVSRQFINQRLTKQVVMDNEVIGKEALGFISKQLHLQGDSLKIESLQGLCDEIKLPYGGFICVMNGEGDLVAAPGLEQMESAHMGITAFRPLGEKEDAGFNIFDSPDPIKGVLTYMGGDVNDIVASLPIGTGDLRLNVHQNTMAVFSQTRSFLNGLVPISIIVSILITLLSYLTVDRIVKGYESKIETQNVLIARKNKDLTDSIKYAGYLQNSYLPSRNTMEKLFSESFILLKPREMVSGDFFYVDQVDKTLYFSVIDCTGHGVPGSLLSMIGYGLLEEALHIKMLKGPGQIMNYLCRRFPETLTREGDWKATDGMDLTICSITPGEGIVRFSGAKSAMLLVREEEIIKYKGDNYSIGMVAENQGGCFVEHEIEIRKDDMIYLHSDGYVDQFGGPNDKKFMMSRLKKMLLDIYLLPVDRQLEQLEETLAQWQGDSFQVDDITVMGVKITPELL